MKLTNVDIRILKYLMEKGLTSSERVIANELHIKPTTLSYRLRKMEEQKIILGYRYRLDFSKIGLPQAAWVFFRLKHNVVDPDKIMQKFLSYSAIHGVLFVTGEYDVGIKFCCKDTDAVTKFVLNLESELSDFIDSSATYFVTKCYKMHQTLVKQNEKPILGKTDLEILKYIVSNPKANIAEISSALKIHRNTVSIKLRNLFKEGVIIKRGVIISPDYYYDVGIAFRAIVFIDAAPGCKEKLAEELAKNPVVHELNLITFPHDILAVVRTPDIYSFYLLSKRFYAGSELAKMTKRINSAIILHSVSRTVLDYNGLVNSHAH